jgi:hypothetical protein
VAKKKTKTKKKIKKTKKTKKKVKKTKKTKKKVKKTKKTKPPKGVTVKGVTVKKHPGTTFPAKPRPRLVGDSYQADARDLRKIRRIAKKHRVSKAELLRYGTKLVLFAYEAKEQGKKTVTIKLTEVA